MSVTEQNTSTDLYIDQNVSWSLPVTLKDENGVVIDITSSTVKAEIRETTETATVTQAFTVVLTDATNGLFTLSLTAVQTKALDFGNKNYLYDCIILYSGGTSERLLQGAVYLQKGLTEL